MPEAQFELFTTMGSFKLQIHNSAQSPVLCSSNLGRLQLTIPTHKLPSASPMRALRPTFEASRSLKTLENDSPRTERLVAFAWRCTSNGVKIQERWQIYTSKQVYNGLSKFRGSPGPFLYTSASALGWVESLCRKVFKLIRIKRGHLPVPSTRAVGGVPDFLSADKDNLQ